MQISVKYLSVLSSATGKEAEFLEVENNISVEKLVEVLSRKYSPRFKDIIYMNSSSRKYLVSFLINDCFVKDDYKLKEGDELTILLALGGG